MDASMSSDDLNLFIETYLEPEPRMPDGWRLNPLLISCSGRHCRKGRMCQNMADMFRRAARHDGQVISDLQARLAKRDSS